MADMFHGKLMYPQIDPTAFRTAVIRYLYTGVDRICNDYIRVMQEELDRSGPTVRDASDRISKWKEMVKKKLQIVDKRITPDALEVEVGIKSDSGTDEVFRKAYIIGYGGGPTYAGPLGRDVWDEDYAKHVKGGSKVKTVTKVPATWHMSGNQWLENAEKRFLSTYLPDGLDQLMRDMPQSVWEGCLKWVPLNI